MKNVKWGIVALVGTLILGGCNALGLGKSSRTWIEDQVSVVDKVYPTENLFDLFDKFPDGFTVKSSYLYNEDEDAAYRQEINLVGDPETKTITGSVQNIKSEAKPYRETILMESGLTYTGNGYQFDNPEVTESDLYFKQFLFQSLTLNKEILAGYQMTDKGYSYENGTFSIDYSVQDKIINNFFNLDTKAKVELHIGMPHENATVYGLRIKADTLYYSERVEPGELE